MSSALRFADLGERILDAARRNGAGEAEAYFQHGNEVTVKVFDAEVESLTAAEARGVGLRVFAAGQMGFAHTSDLSDSELAVLVDQAVSGCRYSEPDEHAGLPDREPDGDIPGLVADDFDELSIDERVGLAIDLDRRAGAAHAEVRRTAGTTFGDERSRTELYTTRGVAAGFEATVAYAYVETIAERGDEMQSGFSFTYGRSPASLDVESCAVEAAVRAARLLGAQPVTSRTAPVLLEPWAAASIVGSLASSISADAVQKKRSLLAGRLGQQIASDCVSIVDDGRRPDGLASRPWDAEGVTTQRTEVVGSGVLRSYLHNSYTARRDGRAISTGNASRASYRSTPELGPSNLLMQPGGDSPEDLLRRMGDGLLVSDVHGLHTVNPVTGEFSLGVNGMLVEDGVPTRPVREVTIAGTLLELLGSVEAVGHDLRFTFGAGFLGAPSVLVRQVAISGT